MRYEILIGLMFVKSMGRYNILPKYFTKSDLNTLLGSVDTALVELWLNINEHEDDNIGLGRIFLSRQRYVVEAELSW